MNKYGKQLIGAALGDRRLFTGDDSDWETSWKPSEPEATATLWRYMSFAKFYSLLERKELFFALVGDMEDRYEGFISPIPREHGDRVQQAEHQVNDVLRKSARTALISCWTESGHESSLMWETYADADGVAVRTTFQHLKESIPPVAGVGAGQRAERQEPRHEAQIGVRFAGRNKLIHLIGLGEVVARLGRSFAECLHRPVQAAGGFPDGNQLTTLTLHDLFSHAPQTRQPRRTTIPEASSLEPAPPAAW